MFIHDEITKAVLPLLKKYDLELIDLIGELNHAAWELSVLNKSGIEKLINELQDKSEYMTPTQKLFEQYAYSIDAVANEPICHDPIARKRLLAACANGLREAARGHARYEALRILNRAEFLELWRRNLAGENFDSLVDDLVKAKNES